MQLNHGSEENRCWERTFVAWCFAVVMAVSAYAPCAAIINRVYNPDLSQNLELVTKLTMLPVESFDPELKEKALFLSGMLLLPILLVLLYLPVRKKLSQVSEKVLGNLYKGAIPASVIAVALLTWLVFSAENPFHGNPANNNFDDIARTNFQFYLLGTFLHDYFALYLLILFPLFMVILLNWERIAGLLPGFTVKTVKSLPYIGYLVLICLVIVINTFRFPYSMENKWDFNAIYYSVVQVFYGSPLLVDNFTNTYGLYPHFVVPVLKLTGMSVASFSGLMSILAGICFLLLLFFLLDNLKNPAITFCCFCSILFYCHFYHKLVTPYDSAFANQPIRALFPCLSLCLATVLFRKQSMVLALSGLSLLACGVLWNPEFGSLSFLSFTLFLLYREASNPDRKKMFRNMIIYAGSAVASLAVVFSLYALFIRGLYGEFPALFDMFKTIKMFSLLGYYMLPMPLFHPWNLVALLYLIGIARSILVLIKGRVEKFDAVIFLVTLLGLGTLSYYQGRSHNWNLPVTFPYAFLLMGLLADSLLPRAREKWLHALPCAMLLFPLAGSFPQFLYNSSAISALIHDSRNRIENYPEQQTIENNAAFIAQHTQEGEKVVVLSLDHYQSLYYSLSRTRSAINPGLMDLFWRRDYDRFIRFLALNRDVKVFVDQRGVAAHDDRLETAISLLYDPKLSNGTMVLMERKTGI